uniref:Uncharacterized protein n=1 Tax=Octopus bimaculoides TaxID=37653 RepID=A0A0L8GP22_OCTBM
MIWSLSVYQNITTQYFFLITHLTAHTLRIKLYPINTYYSRAQTIFSLNRICCNSCLHTFKIVL